MDHIERGGRILVALALYWCLYMIVQHVFDMQVLTLNGELENALILSICFEDMKMNDCSVWAFERNVGFMDRLLLGSFTEKMFKQRTCVCHNTFKFLCEMLGPYSQRKNTQMTWTILVESRVAMSLQRLGTGNTLCTVGEVYGVAKSTISEIVQFFCNLVRVHLQGTFVQFPSPARFRIPDHEFEALHGIPRSNRWVSHSNPCTCNWRRGLLICRRSFHSFYCLFVSFK